MIVSVFISGLNPKTAKTSVVLGFVESYYMTPHDIIIISKKRIS